MDCRGDRVKAQLISGSGSSPIRNGRASFGAFRGRTQAVVRRARYALRAVTSQ